MSVDRGSDWVVEELEAFLEPFVVATGSENGSGRPHAVAPFDVIPPGSVPEQLPERLTRMLREPGGDDRSKQAFSFVMTALVLGCTDAEITALSECHRPTAMKFGSGAGREASRILAKHRPEHDHAGRWCKDVGCPNEPRWMIDEPDERDGGDDPAVAGRAALMRSRLLSVDQVKAMPNLDALIDGVLVAQTLAVLWGKPAGGKSFVALDWGLSIATASWWFGREVKAGSVLYVAAEGGAGLGPRIETWQTDRRIWQVDPGQFGVYPTSVNLLDKSWASALVELVKILEPSLVIIDTLARCSVGGEENSAKDMGVFIDVCDRLRVVGATVLLVHHSRKLADAMRGSSAIEGAADTLIELKAEGQAITLVCGKQKDGREFEPIRLWRAEVGDSCVIQSHEGRGTNDEPTVSEETLLRAAWDSCGSDGLPPSDLIEITGLPKSTFYRAQKALVARGALRNVGTEKRPRYRTGDVTTE